MTVAEAGRRGGRATKKRHGTPASLFFKEIGRKGGQALREKYGHDHFVAIGKKGAARMKELLEAGKKEKERG